MRSLIALSLLLCASTGFAASKTVEMHLVSDQGIGDSIGTIQIEEVPGGLKFTPDLNGLPRGVHGFHIHEFASCEPAVVNGMATAAGAAGDHFDPAKTGKHEGPWGNGHLGDLPPMTVNADGQADISLPETRLKTIAEITNHALVLDTGGDEASLQRAGRLHPAGKHIACGVIR
ncbi:superoxide dismutase [Cu-Zn] [Salmonella enterica subsp. enterica serovar Choleraesuis]|nr:superoxide dismutase [Cu-Zn] [Salmonella enterica subsp. enterica serovar Choleraesuis]